MAQSLVLHGLIRRRAELSGDIAKLRRRLDTLLLKSELKCCGLSYRQLVEKLATIGIHETELNIKNKISRVGFTAVFFVQCLRAIDCYTLRLSDA